MTCEFAHHDGAYVLGALSPVERSQYSAHLAGCAECTRDLAEVAGLPVLLARVPQGLLETPISEPPDTLLPSLVKEVRRTRRRRGWMAVGMAAAAVVVVGVAVRQAVDDPGAPTARQSPGVSATDLKSQPMVPVGSEPMTARLALTSVAWGTRVDLACSYASTPYGDQDALTYAMFVRTRDGKVEQVATWRARPGRTMRLTAATAARRSDITSVEIRTATGEPVLKSVS
jgi:anti-sigma factor RsiW